MLPQSNTLVKFATLPTTKAEDITRALLVHVDVKDIEAIQQDPGRGNWSVTFTEIATAEQIANNGFLLMEEHIMPLAYRVCLVTATVAFVPPGTTRQDVEDTLEQYAEAKQVLHIYMRDFPTIKSGKFRVVLQPKGEGPPKTLLPAYISINGTKGALLFASRIPRCPYCNSADHFVRDCPCKGQKLCHQCGELGHLQANCPAQPDNNDVEHPPEANAEHPPKTNKENLTEENVTPPPTAPQAHQTQQGTPPLTGGTPAAATAEDTEASNPPVAPDKTDSSSPRDASDADDEERRSRSRSPVDTANSQLNHKHSARSMANSYIGKRREPKNTDKSKWP
ncbi:hypothetical protein OS493_016888 [Desmophyllum pertusum]|uniref:CCHC-type domain-containing protein n=1 Tax=Desmophyllum pertusum TaxID=174260 RepID=A0A9W9YNK3_9CNID|nr:hypothetical protein OS493_016888 [Desmophyllum pertusum]